MMDYECPYCKQEVALETDGYEVLDGECPECGEDIAEDAQSQHIGNLVTSAEDLVDYWKHTGKL